MPVQPLNRGSSVGRERALDAGANTLRRVRRFEFYCRRNYFAVEILSFVGRANERERERKREGIVGGGILLSFGPSVDASCLVLVARRSWI